LLIPRNKNIFFIIQIQKKIVQVNDIVFSSAGSYSEQINFALFCQTRKPERNDQLGIQRFFIDFGKWLKEQNIEINGQINNHYFLVFEKRLFHYQHNAVQEILEDDFATDGAGFREAYMAMHLGKSVKEAIDLTVEMNVWTSGEAQIVEINKLNQYIKSENENRPNIPSTNIIKKDGI